MLTPNKLSMLRSSVYSHVYFTTAQACLRERFIVTGVCSTSNRVCPDEREVASTLQNLREFNT